MPTDLTQLFPPEVAQILEVLFLSFLVGLEREEHKGASTGYVFGGVRTFPLLGVVGYGIGILDPTPMLLAAGLVVLAALLGLSYWHKLKVQASAGATTELTGLATYLVGALIARDHPWLACAIVVVTLLMLELKTALEALANRLPSGEIVALAKFLLLSAVILPVVPDEDFTPFHLNPFKTWLVVVAVSAVSYGGYLLERFSDGKLGVFASAMLGGAYSSTATTVVLAKRSVLEGIPHRFAGAIVGATGVMYLRLAALLALFNLTLAEVLVTPLVALGIIGVATGWLVARRTDASAAPSAIATPRNPLELRSAFMFAGIFVVVLVVTRVSIAHLGHEGLYALAALMGVSDVDPFIMGLTQTAGTTTTMHDAAIGVLVAASSNNVMKAIYARAFGAAAVGTEAALVLVALAVLGVAAIWLV